MLSPAIRDPKTTTWHVEINMASHSGSSNMSDLDDDSGAESSDIVSENFSSSEEESSESGSDSDGSTEEEIAALWTRVYPPEPDDRLADMNFTARNPGIQNMPAADSSPMVRGAVLSRSW